MSRAFIGNVAEYNVSACAGKQQFENYVLANAVVRKMRRQKKVVNIYRCRLCHNWHVGQKRYVKEDGR